MHFLPRSAGKGKMEGNYLRYTSYETSLSYCYYGATDNTKMSKTLTDTTSLKRPYLRGSEAKGSRDASSAIDISSSQGDNVECLLFVNVCMLTFALQ